MSYITNSLFYFDAFNVDGFSYSLQDHSWYGTTVSREFIPVGLGKPTETQTIYSLRLPETRNTSNRTAFNSKSLFYSFSGYYNRLISGYNILCTKGVLVLNVEDDLKIVMLAARKKDLGYGDSVVKRTVTRLYIDPVFESVEPTLFRYFKKHLFPDIMAGGTPIIYVKDIRGMYFDGVKIPKFVLLPQRIEWEKQLIQAIPDEVLTEPNEEE